MAISLKEVKASLLLETDALISRIIISWKTEKLKMQSDRKLSTWNT